MGLFSNMIGNMKEKARQKEHDKIAMCIEKANKGDRLSQLHLAQYYSGISDLEFRKSEELPTDDRRAYEIFCSLASRMEYSSPYSEFGAEAAYYAILHIIEGKGTTRNYMKAIEYLEDLSTHSNDLFYGAKKCKKKIFELRDMFEKKLKENPNDSEVAYCLAYLYYFYCGSFAEAAYETPPEKFKEKALEMGIRAKELGDKNAIFLMTQIKGDGKIDLLKYTTMYAALGIPWALNLMAHNMIKKQKNYEQGIQYAEESLRFEERYCYNRQEMNFLLGFAYFMIDEYEKAEKAFINAISEKTDLDTLDNISESYNMLGMIYERTKSNSQSDISKALSYYKKSMDLGSSNGKKHYEELSEKINS